MNKSRIEVREELLTELFSLPVHNLTANKKEISIRCPACGDSVKHSYTSHLYINVDPDSEKFLQYYCQRCKTKGYFNSNTLKSLKLKNPNLALHLEQEAINGKRQGRGSKAYNKKKRYVKFPIYKDTKRNRLKLKYINTRLGTKLSYNDLASYKIILSLYEYLDINHITKLTCKERFGDTIDDNFIGFLSYDNSYVVCRNLSKSILPELRYYNYNIYDDYTNTKKFYVLPTKIDVMQDHLTVIITEGIFDLLGVYHHIETKHDNVLYVAVCGIGYNNVIEEILRLGFLNIDLKIYGDADQDIRIYRNLKTDYVPFIKNIELYLNNKSKDFGDYRTGYEIRRMIL